MHQGNGRDEGSPQHQTDDDVELPLHLLEEVYIYKTSGYIQNNGHLYIPNVLLVHLSQTNEDKFHHGWKVVSLVPKRDAYIYQLKPNNAIAPCNESFRTFVVQDVSEENLLLKVIIFTLK